MSAEVWYTAELSSLNGRGERLWQGVCYTPGGPFWRVRRSVNAVGDMLPRGAVVRYRTRPLRSRNNAFEAARSRTIHHNVYHTGDTRGHLRRWCHE